MRKILMAAVLALGAVAAAPAPVLAEATLSQVQFPGPRTDVVPVQPRGFNPNGRQGPAPQQYRAEPRRYAPQGRDYGRRYDGRYDRRYDRRYEGRPYGYGRRSYNRPYYID